MKMKAEHYAILLAGFKRYTLKQLEDHMQAYTDAGLTARRALFDVFYTVQRHTPEVCAMMREFYEYANDDHLHTALKKAVRHG